MLELLVFICWFSFAAYGTWFFGWAKHYVALSPKDVYVLWAIHKREARCKSLSYLYKIQGKEGIVGFRCLCGYEYLSKRPIIHNLKPILKGALKTS